MLRSKQMHYLLSIILLLFLVYGCAQIRTTEQQQQVTRTNEIVISNGLYFQLENNAYKIVSYSGNETEVTIPKRINGYPVTIIDDHAFEDENITKIIIPNTIIMIGNHAFCSTKLSELVFEENSSLSTIGYHSFANNFELGKIEIPNSVTTIEPTAFEQSFLLEVTFESGSRLTNIAEYTFSGTGLQKITIPKSVTTIHNRAFSYTNLRVLNFEENTQLKTIGDNAFRQAELNTITIPASVTTIGENAFFSSRLSVVKFASNSKIKTIGDKAFAHNPDLAIFEIPIDTPPTIGIGLFDKGSSELIIYVPSEAINIYHTTNNWSKYLIDSIEN